MNKCETCRHYVESYRLDAKLKKWLFEHGFYVETRRCVIGGCKSKDYERYEKNETT